VHRSSPFLRMNVSANGGQRGYRPTHSTLRVIKSLCVIN
ncbi:unnamed protein product, partial [Acidocella sp. C78]